MEIIIRETTEGRFPQPVIELRMDSRPQLEALLLTFESPAAAVLEEMGVDAEKIRTEMQVYLSSKKYTRRHDSSKFSSRLAAFLQGVVFNRKRNGNWQVA